MVCGMVFRCVLCAHCTRLDETRRCGQTVCVDWCEPVLAMNVGGLRNNSETPRSNGIFRVALKYWTIAMGTSIALVQEETE